MTRCPEQVRTPPPSSSNITWHESKVTAEDRTMLHRQIPATIWLTGFSAAGKSTVAYELERCLHDRGHACFVLDGDNIRQGLSADLGFGPEGRRENIRRVAEVAKLFNDAGLVVITAFISPYREDRAMARHIVGAHRFFETYLAADISICERRDPRGLYRRARSGDLPHFTGISAPYERPENPAIEVDTGVLSVAETVSTLLHTVLPRLHNGRST